MKLTLPLSLMIVLILLSSQLNAQYKLTRDTFLVINNMQYGYTITNIESKEDYERYEIRFFINNTGCTKYLPKRNNTIFGDGTENAIAEFNCINATGKRLTNKKSTLKASNWNIRITESMNKELAGKYIQVGYIFRSGESIFGNEVMLTPKGELPIIQVSPSVIQEMN